MNLTDYDEIYMNVKLKYYYIKTKTYFYRKIPA